MFAILVCIAALAGLSRVEAVNGIAGKDISLPVPEIISISEFEVNETIIDWLPVKDNGGVVLGYKAKMWEVGCINKRRFKTENGERVRVVERVMPRLRDASTLRNLQEYTLEGVENSSLVLNGLPEDVPFHIVVAAYSALGEGAASPPFRFQLRGRFNCRI